MHNHEPRGYVCPFCRLVRGEDTERNRLADIVLRRRGTTAFVSPKWWESNPAHVLVVPDQHVENVYDADPVLLGEVYASARLVACALRAAYGCEGTSMRQHNEPGGRQDVWHLHVHVFPRYAGDDLYRNDDRVRWATPAERAPFAERLRTALDGLDS